MTVPVCKHSWSSPHPALLAFAASQSPLRPFAAQQAKELASDGVLGSKAFTSSTTTRNMASGDARLSQILYQLILHSVLTSAESKAND